MLRMTDSLFIALLFFTANFLPFSPTTAQNGIWNELEPNEYPEFVLSSENELATSFDLYKVDIERIRARALPIRSEGETLRLELPWRGQMRTFVLERSDVLDRALSRKYPGIRTFKGSDLQREIDVRLSLTPLGIQALFFSTQGNSILHAADPEHDKYHYSYTLEEAVIPEEALRCGFENDDQSIEQEWKQGSVGNRGLRGDSVELRTYRLVIGSPAEYTNFVGGTVSAAMSSLTNIVNSMNGYMNRDAGLEFELIEETENLIFVEEENDPYPSSGVTGDFLSNNSSIVPQFVDPSKYDVAHVFSVFCSGGAAGISGGSIVCDTEFRNGAGVSCTYGSLFGFIMTTTHEFGHHLSASHTFSNCPGSDGQLAGGTAYEPGSGSTIMSYSGACGSQNLGADDDYFHGANIEQMRFYVTQNQGNSCGTLENFGNTKPEVSIPLDDGFYIPVLTPFELTADASDMENDPLTYCWEEFDLGPKSPLGEPILNAPAFRSFPPKNNPTRIFPQLSDILNDNDDPTEVLVDYSRDFNFRCTVRDNNEDNGAQNWAQVHFLTTDKAGPFKVLDFTQDTLFAGEYVEVRWDVAKTDKPPVNCESVDIWLSTDGGRTFDISLLRGVPNTGSAFITVPNIQTEDARIKVKASNSIFFNISERDLRIEPATKPGYLLALNQANISVCLPSTVEIALPTESLLGFENDINFELADTVPANINAYFSPPSISPGDTSRLIVEFDNRPMNSNYNLSFRSTATDGDTLLRTISFTLISNDFSTLATEQPPSGMKSVQPAPVFSWHGTPAADKYTLQMALNPSFEELVFEQTGIQDTFFDYPDLLASGTLFYWRVLPLNSCGAGQVSETSAFQTKLVDCQVYQADDLPKFISSNQGATVNSNILIENGGLIEDVNIPNINGSHQYVGDIRTRLISPQGTTVKLWSNECFNSTDFNLGFDDDSPKDLACPLTTGQIYQPQQSLSVLQGEDASGEWTLKIVDTEPGSSGRLESWKIELCSSASANPPYLVRNDTLALPRGARRTIRSEFHLLVRDDNTSPENIHYTLVKAPANGTLMRYNTPVETGDQFTQRELYDWFISYKHDSSTVTEDHFRFVAEDPDNGWTGIHQFNITIDDHVVVSTDDPQITSDLYLFPNPASDRLHVELPKTEQGGLLEIIDLNGRMLYREQIDESGQQSKIIDLGQWNPGMYFIRYHNDKRWYQSRFIVN